MRHCARAAQLLSKERRSGGELLATLCQIGPTRGSGDERVTDCPVSSAVSICKRKLYL